MEKQRISLLRLENRWGLTALCIAVCVVLSPVLGMALFIPQVLPALPVLLLAMLGYVGPVSAAACTVTLIVLCFSLFGGWGALCCALLLVPALVVSSVVLEREQPFWQAVAAAAVTFFASLGAIVALLSALAGSDVVTALTELVRQAFNAPESVADALLTIMMQMGAVSMPAEGVDFSAGVAVIDPAVREEMIAALLRATDSVMRLEIPMLMATGAVCVGLLGQAVLRKGLLRRGVAVEYPRLRTWRIPKGWGRILGGTLAALYLLAQLVPQSMSTMFYVFSGVFDQVFALQGIAAVCYLLHKHGKSSIWQKVVFVLGYSVLGTAAMVVGIADQAMDFTHRREELDKLENPFDPRRGE